MLIQHGHIIFFQSSENDLQPPLKNETTIISKTKYDCKHTIVMVHEIQTRLV